MRALLGVLTTYLVTVLGQESSFQVTNINGRPVASSGSLTGRPNGSSGNNGGSSFSISSVNGRPVGGSSAASNLDTNLIHVDVQLVRFENPGSLMHDGRFCDTASKCDPQFTADLDTKTPLAAWPGSKPFSAYEKVFEISNTDSFDIGRVVSRDVCASANLANLRVRVEDIDDVTQPDLIDEYECTFDITNVAEGINAATWGPIVECKSLHHSTPPFVKLFYRHREYALPRDLNRGNC